MEHVARCGVVEWLDERLAAAGAPRIGEPTRIRERPWGTVLTAPTTGGPVWLKIPGPQTRYEVPLYRILARVVPAQVPAVIAVDVELGRVLLADGGAPLSADPDGMSAVVRPYGELQRALAPHVEALLAAGVPDMRPAVMPERFEEAVAAVARYVERHGDGADRETLRRVVALRATFRGWCERLARSPVPVSLDHNDLHPGNVLRRPGEDGARFYDWGDSVVAHPFASMLVSLGRVGRPAARRVRERYLAAFADLAPAAELEAELDLACQVAKAARVLTWERALGGPDRSPTDRFARAPLETLASLLAPPP